MPEETTAKTYWLLKEGGSCSSQLCSSWVDGQQIWKGKHQLVKEKVHTRMMSFADASEIGGTGNLQNRKANMDS